MFSESLISEARGLGAASLHEAAGQVGALPSRIRAVGAAGRVCGPAFTVSTPPGDNLALHHALAAAPGGWVLVVDACDGDYGHWGDVMSASAAARGVAGLVIDGGVRDMAVLARGEPPVFASRTSLRGTTKDPNRGGTVGAPLLLGEAPVVPGDLVLGDADGVVVVPARQAEAAVAKARQREHDEQESRARLVAGETTLDLYGLPPLSDRPAPVPARRGRRSVEVEGLDHGGAPFPMACVVGGVVLSSGISGRDPETGVIPDDLNEQVANVFANIRRTVQAAGGAVDDIGHVRFFVRDRSTRDLLNSPWSAMFPDRASRPSRHTLTYDLPGSMLVQCEITAVLPEGGHR